MAAEKPKQLSLKRNMLWNSVGSITRLVCNYLITVAVVRLSHGFDAAGIYGLCTTLSALINPFADFRLRTVHVTDATGEHSTGEYIGMRIVTTVGSFIGGIIYALISFDHELFLILVLYLISALIPKFSEGLQAENQRNMRMDYNGISYILQGIGVLLGFSIVLWLSNSLVWAFFTMVLVELAILLFFDIPVASKLADLHPIFDWTDIARTLIKLLPLALAQVAAAAVLAIPKQYLGTSVSREALGIYNSVAAPAALVQVGATYIYSPLMSEIAKRFHSNKKSALVLLAKASIGITVLCVVFSISLVFLGEWVLTLIFGEKIIGYTHLLQPAILCTFVSAFCWFANDILLALRDFKATLLGNVVAALATLLFYRQIINSFGMNGVSYAGIVAYLMGIAIMIVFMAYDYKKLEV